jgi:hypothetical protein
MIRKTDMAPVVRKDKTELIEGYRVMRQDNQFGWGSYPCASKRDGHRRSDS